MEKKLTSGCKEFQEVVDQCLLRHCSIMDVLSKLHETSARIQRATVKAITDCGCISVQAGKQTFPSDCTLGELKAYLTSQVQGELCENCKEVLEAELGHNLFYIAALCNTLGLDLEQVLAKEEKRLHTLGPFQMR